MIHKSIELRAGNPDVRMDTYIIDDPVGQNRKRPLVVVCPGGGYSICSPTEAEPIALQFNAAGIHAVVVYYSVGVRYPEALKDLSKAVETVRAHADEWCVKEDKIVVCGFSAGAHLAGSLGVLWNKEPQIKCENAENKPNGMILSYPVITSGEKAHRGSFDVITGNDAELLELTSLEKQVSSDTPPAFIWHTFTDDCVPVENSLLMTQAMAEHKINTELHIYPRGRHGLSLANPYAEGDDDETGTVPEVQNWIDMAVRWVKEL